MPKTQKSKLSPYPKEVYERNSRIYKVMANSKRLEIMNILKQGEISVKDLTEAVGARLANVSQHLAILRAHRLVKARRYGKVICYSLTDDRIVEPCRIFKDLAYLIR